MLGHPFVIGELAMGNFAQQAQYGSAIWAGCRSAWTAREHEVLSMIGRSAILYGRGIGLCRCTFSWHPPAFRAGRLWTRDRRLAAAADEMGIGFQAARLTPFPTPATSLSMDTIQSREARGRVADAPTGHWSTAALPRALWPFAQLARWDRPDRLVAPDVAVLVVGQRLPSPHPPGTLSWQLPFHLALFMIGAIAMRGCRLHL